MNEYFVGTICQIIFLEGLKQKIGIYREQQHN